MFAQFKSLTLRMVLAPLTTGGPMASGLHHGFSRCSARALKGMSHLRIRCIYRGHHGGIFDRATATEERTGAPRGRGPRAMTRQQRRHAHFAAVVARALAVHEGVVAPRRCRMCGGAITRHRMNPRSGPRTKRFCTDRCKWRWHGRQWRRRQRAKERAA
jgi:hypothetical protein